jgi:hypothetical protein
MTCSAEFGAHGLRSTPHPPVIHATLSKNGLRGAALREVQLNLNRAVDLVLHDADLLLARELKHG